MLSAGTSKFKSEKEDLGTGSVISSSKKKEENGKKITVYWMVRMTRKKILFKDPTELKIYK